MDENNITKAKRIRAFGVGCFSFRLKDKVPFQITVREYAQQIEQALSHLNSLTDLEISYDESSGEREMQFDEEIPSLRDGGVFPFLPFGAIHFTLYIPTRIQEEIDESVQTKTDRFRVSIRDGFFGPVSYVESLDSGEECYPSSAVRIVREYLKKEFNKSARVEFEVLGPSPFHVDFFAHEDLSSSGIEVAETPELGYDRMDIKIGNSSLGPDALEDVFDDFNHELDLFYHLVRQRVIQMRNWEALEGEWSALRENVKTPVKFYEIARKFDAHKRARNLITDAYTFAATHSVSKQDSREALAMVYRKGLQTRFKKRAEAQLREAFPEYPVHSIIAWATHVHDSSFKLAELVTVFLSGLVGGVIGALVTALLTMPSATSGSRQGQAVTANVPTSATSNSRH